ncbi:mucin-2-like [Ornithodoros turicata]|uniref:mucin-2-like n=1 Tax=Ornithodoros turicata TaxID=34597 RepID=UPI003139B023
MKAAVSTWLYTALLAISCGVSVQRVLAAKLGPLCPASAVCLGANVTRLLRHPTNCEKFCDCIGGYAYEKSCPQGLHFNPVLRMCDRPGRAGCVDASRTKRQVETNGSEEKECPSLDVCNGDDPYNTRLFAHPTECHKYCRCRGGHAYEITCPHGLYFNKLYRVCDIKDHSTCPDTPSSTSKKEAPALPKPQSTEKPLSTSNVDKLPQCPSFEVCEGDDPFVTRLFPHPYDCRKYCHCTTRYVYEKTCPSDLYFHPIHRVCDRQRHSGCEQKLSTERLPFNVTTSSENTDTLQYSSTPIELPGFTESVEFTTQKLSELRTTGFPSVAHSWDHTTPSTLSAQQLATTRNETDKGEALLTVTAGTETMSSSAPSARIHPSSGQIDDEEEGTASSSSTTTELLHLSATQPETTASTEPSTPTHTLTVDIHDGITSRNFSYSTRPYEGNTEHSKAGSALNISANESTTAPVAGIARDDVTTDLYDSLSKAFTAAHSSIAARSTTRPHMPSDTLTPRRNLEATQAEGTTVDIASTTTSMSLEEAAGESNAEDDIKSGTTSYRTHESGISSMVQDTTSSSGSEMQSEMAKETFPTVCKDPGPTGMVPHHCDCTLFYLCTDENNQDPDVFKCPSRLHFNPVLRMCDMPEHAGCPYAT